MVNPIEVQEHANFPPQKAASIPEVRPTEEKGKKSKLDLERDWFTILPDSRVKS